MDEVVNFEEERKSQRGRFTVQMAQAPGIREYSLHNVFVTA